MERQPFRYSDNEGTFFTGMLQIALGVFIGALAALFAYEAISAYRMKLAAQDAAKEMKAAADIRERSIAGQIAARARGRMPGRVRALPSEDEAALVAEYAAGGITQAGLATKYGVSPSVVKRAIQRAKPSA